MKRSDQHAIDSWGWPCRRCGQASEYPDAAQAANTVIGDRNEGKLQLIRRAFTMRLKPGGLAEYRRNHDEIWEELVAEIARQGIAQITIFENDPVLFLYSEINDEDAWDRLWRSEVHARWGEVMDPLMEFGPDGVVASSELREVFNLRPAERLD